MKTTFQEHTKCIKNNKIEIVYWACIIGHVFILRIILIIDTFMEICRIPRNIITNANKVWVIKIKEKGC